MGFRTVGARMATNSQSGTLNYQAHHRHFTKQIQAAQLKVEYMMDAARSLACSILPTGAHE